MARLQEPPPPYPALVGKTAPPIHEEDVHSHLAASDGDENHPHSRRSLRQKAGDHPYSLSLAVFCIILSSIPLAALGVGAHAYPR